jgi:hypothetical protein
MGQAKNSKTGARQSRPVRVRANKRFDFGCDPLKETMVTPLPKKRSLWMRAEPSCRSARIWEKSRKRIQAAFSQAFPRSFRKNNQPRQGRRTPKFPG